MEPRTPAIIFEHRSHFSYNKITLREGGLLALKLLYDPDFLRPFVQRLQDITENAMTALKRQYIHLLSTARQSRHIKLGSKLFRSW